MLYIVIICAVFVIAVLFSRYRALSLPTPMATAKAPGADDKHQKPAYKATNSFLSSSELTLYKSLVIAAHGQAIVNSKVHISALAMATRARGRRVVQSPKNTVLNTSFDFVICDPDTLQPLCVVDVRRRGLTRARGLAEKNFKIQVCAAIDLPIVFLDPQSQYDVADVRSKVTSFLPKVQKQTLGSLRQSTTIHPAPKPTPKPALKPALKPAPKKLHKFNRECCPKCNSPMVVRVAKRGDKAGEKFRVCIRYPRCRTASPI